MRTAIKLDPESWEVNREAARMLFRHGHLREAIPFFDKAVSLMESDWHNPLMLVTCHRSTGNKAELNKAARISFDRAEKAIAKEPTNGGALAAGANALAIIGDKERALEWVRRALLLDPDNNIMRYNLGCMLIQEIGAVDEALKTFEPFFQRLNSSTHMRHIEVDPDVDPIRDDPRFKEMLAAAKERLGMTPDAAAAAAE